MGKITSIWQARRSCICSVLLGEAEMALMFPQEAVSKESRGTSFFRQVLLQWADSSIIRRRTMGTIIFNTTTIDGWSRHAFVDGMTDAFNLRGMTARKYHMHSSGEIADLCAVSNDWGTVGEDLAKIIEEQPAA